MLVRFQSVRLQASISKCEFHVIWIKYLDFIIITEGIKVDSEKVTAVLKWGVSDTVTRILSFLEFCNFYWRFIRNYSKIVKSLTHLTQKNMSFKWDTECQKVFKTFKIDLATASVLQYYDPDLETQLKTNILNNIIISILSQKFKDNWHFIAYYLATISDIKKNYEIYNKEILAIIKFLNI